MKFCDFCDNFLYIKLDEDKKLYYHCKNCNNEITNDKPGSICITDNNYIDDNVNYKQYISKYIKYDSTLPRVKNIKCPNKDCTKPDDKDNEVIYVKYDEQNMKYLYHCIYCDTFWKSEKE
jgi:DNA-directed RNA polymerase subunit M/transcription elongation factor TFIIS